MDQPNNEPDKKKLNDDLVLFMRKRSEHEAPRYTARLKTYVDIHRKRRRAAAARRASEHSCADNHKTSTTAMRKKNDEQKDKTDNGEDTREGEDDKTGHANSEDETRMSKGRSMASRYPTVSSLTLCSIMTSSSSTINLRKSSSAKMRGWFGRRGGEEKETRGRSMSRSLDPSDRCCRRRRRRRCPRRRRRRCCRRRRRRCPRRRRSCCRRRRRRRRC